MLKLEIELTDVEEQWLMTQYKRSQRRTGNNDKVTLSKFAKYKLISKVVADNMFDNQIQVICNE